MSSMVWSPEVIAALQQGTQGAPALAPGVQEGQPLAGQGVPPNPAPQPAPQQPQQPQQDGMSPYLQAGLGAAQESNGAAAGAQQRAEKKMTDAGDAEKAGIRKQADEKAATATGLALQDDEIANLELRHAQETEALNQHVSGMAQEQLDATDALRQQYATDVSKQQGFWADKDVGQRVGWAIAVGLGAWGATLTHTQNGAMEMLESAIQDDARTKERKLGAEKGAIDAGMQTYQGLREAGLDQTQRLAAQQLISLQAAKTRLQGYLDGRQGPEAQAAAQKMMADVDVAIANKSQEFAKMTGDRAQQFAQTQAHILGTAAELEDRKAQRDYDLALAMQKERNGRAHIPGWVGFTPPADAETGKKLQDRAFGAQHLSQTTDNLLKMYGTTDADGKYSFAGRANAAAVTFTEDSYERLKGTLVRQEMAAAGDGVPSGKDIENAEKRIGLPSSYSVFLARPEYYLGQVQKYRAEAIKKVEGFAAGVGVKPRDPRWWDPEVIGKLPVQ